MTSPNVQPDEVVDQRAKFVAGLREFATWVEERPWVPITRHGWTDHQNVRIQVDLDGAEGVEQVRSIGERLGVEVRENLDDRTSVDVRIGAADYSVIAWHKAGRPGELEKLRAERKPLVSDETIAEAAAMEARDREAGGPPWEVPAHPENAQPGGWHRGQITGAGQ